MGDLDFTRFLPSPSAPQRSPVDNAQESRTGRELMDHGAKPSWGLPQPSPPTPAPNAPDESAWWEWGCPQPRISWVSPCPGRVSLVRWGAENEGAATPIKKSLHWVSSSPGTAPLSPSSHVPLVFGPGDSAGWCVGLESRRHFQQPASI